MPHRGTVVALAMLLAGCDDTLYQYPPRIVEYDADWDGVVAFTYDHCRQCHPALVPSVPLPEALEEDVRCEDRVCERERHASRAREAPEDRDHPLDDDRLNAPLVCIDIKDRICGDYVVPGDPEGSYFWRVLSEEAAEPGDQKMPMTGYLPPEQVEFIREWIEAGAPL